MTILLPIVLTPTAGTSTFARKFQTGMKARGHSVVFESGGDYDVLLVPASCHPRFLLHARLNHKPIIQRLDGVYYPQSVVGSRWRWHNLPLKVIYRYFATRLLFQSDYSKVCARTFLGRPPAVPLTTIYNGVDTDHFSPAGPAVSHKHNPNQQIFITWSRFRRADQIMPLLAAVESYRRRYTSNVRLIIAGDFVGAVANLPRQLAERPYVEYVGVVANLDLPRLVRGADVFLFTHQNPPCPNNVLEAMACALPVCGVADGAMPEITTPGINSELVEAAGDGWQSPRSFSTDRFADNLAQIMEQRATYAAASRRIALDRFSLPSMIERYESFILQ